MNHRRWPTSLALSMLLSFAGRAVARGDGVDANPAVRECARAYESAQVQRGAGAISSARPELERCRRDECPAFIRSDCSRWSRELEAEQPTVIFSAKRDGRELIQVRVSVGDRVLLERLDARAVELDPGEYDFRFETSDGSFVVRHVRIQAFNKDRLVQVEFAPSAPAHHAAAPKAASAELAATNEALPKPTAAAVGKGPGVLPWALLAVGAASIGAGAGLAVWGHSNEVHLRDTCSPHCTDAEVQPVHTKYLLSDISFAVGLVTLPVAAYLFLRQPGSEQAGTGTLPVTVVASTNGIQASYGARF